MKKSGLFFAVAGVLLASTWLMYFFLLHNPVLQWLVYTGWVILAVGFVFIFLPMVVLRIKGKPEKGKDFAHTTIIVDSGIYAIVRHPLYLGWLLMYVVVILFSQHWLVVILGILGVVCMYLISRQEDQHLNEKFGDTYKRYMKSVPAMNVFVGIMRLLQRRKEHSKPGAG
jgi:protein-S-isoprenylcysteine O-methyltransferase Ste14